MAITHSLGINGVKITAITKIKKPTRDQYFRFLNLIPLASEISTGSKFFQSSQKAFILLSPLFLQHKLHDIAAVFAEQKLYRQNHLPSRFFVDANDNMLEPRPIIFIEGSGR